MFRIEAGWIIIFIGVLFPAGCLLAQSPVEEYAESIAIVEDPQQGDPELQAEIVHLLDNPVNINSADLDVLVTAGLISRGQLLGINSYRKLYGDLVSIYELQAVPGFDYETVRRLLPHVQVMAGIKDRLLESRAINRGRHSLNLLTGSILERSRGYLGNQSEQPTYTGSPLRVRLQYNYESRHVQFGLTGDKDAGEPFFSQSNRKGFDSYNYHLFIRNASRWVPVVAIGNFNYGLGQGLISGGAFSLGKGPVLQSIWRAPATIRPIRSSNENQYKNGFAAILQPFRDFRILLALSSVQRDANIAVRSEPGGEQRRVFTSLQSSGLHRSASEIEDRKSIKHRNAAMGIRFDRKQLQLGLNFSWHQFNIPQSPGHTLYNQGRLRGRELLNTSADFNILLGTWKLFGEIALSGSSAAAGTLSALVSLNPRTDLVLNVRSFSKGFTTIESSAFSESSSPRNETGIFTGTRIKPGGRWEFTAFIDVWRHSHPTFQSDLPSAGHEVLLKAEYKVRHSINVYAQLKLKQREITIRIPDRKTESLASTRKVTLRLHMETHVNKSVVLRTRAEFSRYRGAESSKSHGVLLLQDVLVQPLSWPVHVSGRIALFDVTDYNARIYAYESDYTGLFGIPPYYGTGLRTYINIRWRASRKLRLDARLSRWKYSNQTSIGSGYDTINGNKKTEWRVRLQYRLGKS